MSYEHFSLSTEFNESLRITCQIKIATVIQRTCIIQGPFTVSGSIRRYRVRGLIDNENIATSGYAGSSHQHFVILNCISEFYSLF